MRNTIANVKKSEIIKMKDLDQARLDIMAIFNDDNSSVASGNGATVSTGDINIALEAIVNQDYSIWYDWYQADYGYTRMSQIDDIVIANIK